MPETPQVSAILPARNEEANIAAAVESLTRQTTPVEIIVVNDASTDRTREILDGLQARLPQLRVIDNLSVPDGWVGKSYAISRGVEQAEAPWLLFTDADVRHHPQAVEKGLATARKTGAALVSFSPEQEMHSWWERAVIPLVYCRLAKQFAYKKVSNPKHRAAAANGQWLLMSRTAYDAVGGHAAVRDAILEDVALARRVKQTGCRLYFARGTDIAATRMYRRFEELWQGWSKNLFLLFDRRRSAVAWAVGVAGLDATTLLVTLVAWAGGASLVAGVAAGLLVFRHLQYALALLRNRYPLSSLLFYEIGNVLVALMMLNSARIYLRGEPVEWKGRQYAVTTQ
ncbi:MAG: glycosyltransferase [Acidobacteria bacterium]|nr:glycosyltransferase [Acidobacteriota bacterium]